jgi:hypothetical protein
MGSRPDTITPAWADRVRPSFSRSAIRRRVLPLAVASTAIRPSAVTVSAEDAARGRCDEWREYNAASVLPTLGMEVVASREANWVGDVYERACACALPQMANSNMKNRYSSVLLNTRSIMSGPLDSTRMPDDTPTLETGKLYYNALILSTALYQYAPHTCI